MSEPVFQYIYVMASSTNGPVKIGRAGSPAKRLRDLQPGHPHRLRVWHAVKVPEDSIASMEVGIHRKLAQHLCIYQIKPDQIASPAGIFD